MRWLMSSTPESNTSAEQRRRRHATAASGKTTMSAAPKKAPRIEARPPMMMMKRISNERSRLKPAGLHGAQIGERPERAGNADDEGRDARRRAAWSRSTGTPMTLAAISLSRTAMKLCPVWAATQPLASAMSAISDDRQREDDNGRAAVEKVIPAIASVGASMTPEGLSFENQPNLVKRPLHEELRGERRYRKIKAAQPQARQAEYDARPPPR